MLMRTRRTPYRYKVSTCSSVIIRFFVFQSLLLMHVPYAMAEFEILLLRPNNVIQSKRTSVLILLFIYIYIYVTLTIF
jgi:hypothetical protein